MLSRQQKIVAIVWSIGLVGAGLGVGLARWEFYRNGPTTEYSGVGVRYLEGTERPWRGIAAAIDAIVLTIRVAYPNDSEHVLERLWIEAVPYEGYCRSTKSPDGLIDIIDDEGTRRRVRLNGTIRRERAPLFGPTYFVLVVRQTRNGEDINDAGHGTALFHEMAHHMVPLKLSDDENASHAIAELYGLEARMQAAYDHRRAEVTR